MQSLAANSLGFSADIVYSLENSIFITLAIGLVVIAPLTSVKEMSAFRYVSLLSLGSLVYILLILIIELPAYARLNYSSERLNFATVNWGIL